MAKTTQPETTIEETSNVPVAEPVVLENPLMTVEVGQCKASVNDGVFFSNELARALSFFTTSRGTKWKVHTQDTAEGQTVVSLVEVKA